MNLQIEKIEGHQARLTVDIEPKRFEDAKRKAARKISRQVNIRGFRKGKAPYKRIAQLIGEKAIIEEAFDGLLQPTFKKALDQSGMNPPGMGSLEDTTTDPPAMIFNVPLEPTVDLGDWQDLRLPWEAPTIDESDVEAHMRRVQLLGLEVVDDDPPETALGHRVYINVESGFLDAEDEEPPDFGDDEKAAEEYYSRGYVEPFATEKNTPIILDPNEDSFMDGFVENLVGATVGTDRIFELTIPEDDADETIRGREVEFQVTINSIEEVAIPELDEDFLPKAAELLNEEPFADMADFRARMRSNLERGARNDADSAYSEQVMAAAIELADVQYPEVAVQNMTNTLIAEFAQRIAQQGVKFEDYLRIAGTDHARLSAGYRDMAEQRMVNSLVLGELIQAMGISADDDDLTVHRASLEAFIDLDGPTMDRDNPGFADYLEQDFTMTMFNAALAALGRGEDVAEGIAAQRALNRQEMVELQQARDRALARRSDNLGDEASDADEDGEMVSAADRLFEQEASLRPINIERRARKT